MIKLKYSIAALLFCLAINIYGQTPPPNKVVLEKDGTNRDFYRHGYNKTTPEGSLKPKEAIDSVTVGAKVKYFVLPDSTANPDFKYDTPADAIDMTKVLSTFNWGFRRSGGSPLGSITSTPTNKHIVEVTWGTTVGVDTIRVRENPTIGCIGSDTKIPVEVIAKPTITFNQVTQPDLTLKYEDGICPTQNPATTNVLYNFPITFSTAVQPNAQVWVTFEVSKNGTKTSPVGGITLPIIVGVAPLGTLPITFTDYGKYEITIINVSDRISRKSEVNGTVPTSNGATFTYNILKPVQTGPIYRIPNNY